MTNRMLLLQVLGALFVAGVLATGSAHAGKPDWAGKERKSRGGDDVRVEARVRGRDDDRRHETRVRVRDDGVRVETRGRNRFGERERDVVRRYYAEAHGAGFCPPGLAMKHNGCMPPGQAKKRWHVGHRLPGDLVYYDVPDRLVIELGLPPRGHKYVRVAGDILMIAVGTGLIVDAIDDLSRL
ncbi:MAG: RcnB family protein [Gammaproteobacteria bacterium]|nr:RcnB family protein [Gammaproteobacteria bacterium]